MGRASDTRSPAEARIGISESTVSKHMLRPHTPGGPVYTIMKETMSLDFFPAPAATSNNLIRVLGGSGVVIAPLQFNSTKSSLGHNSIISPGLLCFLR